MSHDALYILLKFLSHPSIQDYKIYKILKIICNIQNNVIQIAQVFEGYLLNTFDNIFQ